MPVLIAALIFLLATSQEVGLGLKPTNGGLRPGVSPSSLLTGISRVYKMEQTSGSRTDTLGGPSWNAAGSVPSGVGKQGNGAAISIGHTLSIGQGSLFASSTYTLTFWYNPSAYTDDGLNGSPILTSSTAASGFDFMKNPGTNSILFVAYPSGLSTTAQALPATGSYHCVQIWTGAGTCNLQVDGGTVRTLGANCARSSGTMIMGFTSTVGVAAVFDEMVVQTRILSAPERTAACSTFYPF